MIRLLINQLENKKMILKIQSHRPHNSFEPKRKSVVFVALTLPVNMVS